MCRGISRAGFTPNARASNGWHADITFEPVPSDYAVSIFLRREEVSDGIRADSEDAYST